MPHPTAAIRPAGRVPAVPAIPGPLVARTAHIARAARALAAGAALGLSGVSLAACGDDDPTAPASIAGTYTATTFRASDSGRPAVDVLAGGGTLTLTIAADNTTSGTLAVPGAITGGAPLTASMAGTAVRTGNTVRFQQAADTFVRDLTWTVDGRTLRAQNQAAGSGTFTITLTRP